MDAVILLLLLLLPDTFVEPAKEVWRDDSLPSYNDAYPMDNIHHKFYDFLNYTIAGPAKEVWRGDKEERRGVRSFLQQFSQVFL